MFSMRILIGGFVLITGGFFVTVAIIPSCMVVGKPEISLLIGRSGAYLESWGRVRRGMESGSDQASKDFLKIFQVSSLTFSECSTLRRDDAGC